MKWLQYQSSQQRWSRYWLPSTYMVPVPPRLVSMMSMTYGYQVLKHIMNVCPCFVWGCISLWKRVSGSNRMEQAGGGLSTNSSTWSMTKPGVYVGNSWAPKSQLWLFQNSFCRNYTRKQTWVTYYKEALNWNGFEVGSTSFQKYVHKNCTCITYDVYCILSCRIYT